MTREPVYKSRRMQEVEALIGRPIEQYIREHLQAGESVPRIATRLNEEYRLSPPLAVTTVYKWLETLGFTTGRAILDTETQQVYFVGSLKDD